jgi:hypothetical protein
MNTDFTRLNTFLAVFTDLILLSKTVTNAGFSKQ